MERRQSSDRVLSADAGTLSRVLCGRIVALTLVVGGVFVFGVAVVHAGDSLRPALLIAGCLTAAAGVASWWVPWDRVSPWALVGVVPVALVLLDLSFVFTEHNSFNFSVGFVVVFGLVGLTLPRWTAVRLLPVLVAAYVVPFAVVHGSMGELGLSSALFVVPVCILFAETIAWGLRSYAVAEGEIAETAARIKYLFDDARIGISKLELDGTISAVNRAYAEILGRVPEELAGTHVTDLIHPDDRAQRRELDGRLLTGELDRFAVEIRVLHADGRAIWVSAECTIVRGHQGESAFLVEQLEDITERRMLRDELAVAAATDPLTGLPNRIQFMERLDRALHDAESVGRHVAILFLDLDRFKMVNDGIGHEAGDRLLQRVGQRLQRSLRAGDFLARFGGDEFTILCEVSGEDEVHEIIDHLRRAMATPVAEPDFEQFVTLSIGVAVSTSSAMLPSLLMRSADVAMYQAKRIGPGRHVIFAEHDDEAVGHSLRTSNELHRAIDQSQLVLHYQPFVNIDRLTIIGTEALVRWQHPVRGLLGPSEFVDLAEECGLIVELGTWVLRQACGQGASWVSERLESAPGRTPPALSVNVAPQQLAEPGFTDMVSAVLDETGFPPDRLWLEITEGALLRDPTAAIAILRALRALGVHLAIDDFGTGYSSLSYLKELPVEALKIDRTFVEQVDSATDDGAIVEAIVALGRTLGLGVVAEGIERIGQAEELAARGCPVGQGFLYARPSAPADIGPSLPVLVTDWCVGRPLTVA